LLNRQVSLTTPPPTNAKGIPPAPTTITGEFFFSLVEKELSKVEKFTLEKVTELRKSLDRVEDLLDSNECRDNQEVQILRSQADTISGRFLTLEKYVNINFMGFHKILKKHDKYCPANPCKTFYVNRMHSQAWVRGDYSDVVVRMSAIYSTLRNDRIATESNDPSQSFLRSTTKYWIKTEDVSKVKYSILRHLPVFLQKTNTGESDSQLTNSVYFDNDQLELYHGRLDKTPGAIALRMRWYGVGEPNIIFAERKTHQDKWIGEVSVKERFMVKEDEVNEILNATYPIEQKKQEMLEMGSTEEEADDWKTLARDVVQVTSSKQLAPTMRTQYMRTAFQIPFDATVRVSLDTNLCMISERGYDLENNTVWHRDPTKTLAHNEIVRFPHAVLEIKLELKGENSIVPKWVTDLQNSGMLYEVHKFSKFIHGCAVLLPEDVRCVPYWVDDVSLRESILASGGGRILVKTDSDEKDDNRRNKGSGPGANQVYDHLLPFGDVLHDKREVSVGRTSNSVLASKGAIQTLYADEENLTEENSAIFLKNDNIDEEGINHTDGYTCTTTCCGWIFPFCSPHNNYQLDVVAPTSVQKIEPKVLFANERTFLHWLHSGVTLYAIAAGILSFSSEEWAHYYAMMLLFIALGFCLYALNVFLWRADRIKTRIPGRWDDPRGPMLLGWLIVIVLTINFLTKISEILKYDSEL